jgi:hypothetical protein
MRQVGSLLKIGFSSARRLFIIKYVQVFKQTEKERLVLIKQRLHRPEELFSHLRLVLQNRERFFEILLILFEGKARSGVILKLLLSNVAY